MPPANMATSPTRDPLSCPPDIPDIDDGCLTCGDDGGTALNIGIHGDASGQAGADGGAGAGGLGAGGLGGGVGGLN